MNDEKIQGYMNPRKLDAIKIALHRKGQTLETALDRALEKFYKEMCIRDRDNGEPYSVCEGFVTSDTELVLSLIHISFASGACGSGDPSGA